MKTAIIWGAHGGIGRALCTLLKQEDWYVVAISRHADVLEAAVDLSLQADVNSEYDVQRAIQAASFEIDAAQLWIYAVGDITAVPVQRMSLGEWQRILHANLTGAFLTTHHSLPLLASDAHLFYLGAVSERLRLPGLSAYVAAKAGLEAFAEALRKEERRRKVTVVRPGAVATPLWHKVPMALPKNAATAEKVATLILKAYHSGQSGHLDITAH